MGEKNGDAKTFWMELEDGGKVDFVFEKAQDVLQSLKQKIKDGSATNKEYIQAMILVNEATINNNSLLLKDHVPVTQTEHENKPRLFTPTSHESSFPEDCAILSTENKETLPLENKVVDFRKKESTLSSLYQSHICSSECLRKTLLSWKGENPLQQPIQCHFQRRHAKTSSRSSALHVSYRTPCGRSLRNMEEVFHYLLETECNFLCTDNFSFNTYVQLTRNYPKQEEVVSDLDISGGVESVPISFCNEIDSRKLPQFKYRKTIWPRMCYLNSLSSRLPDSCDCSEGCIDIKKCACLQLTAKNARTCPLSTDGISTGYKYKRLKRLIPTGIYECNLLCKCNRHMCQNRLVQHGPQIRLQVFQSEKKGWGVRCLDDIDRGTFVCIYSGRLLSRATPESPTATDGGGGEQDLMKTTLSKKRRVEVACSCCETHPGSPETDPREANMCVKTRFTTGLCCMDQEEMNYKNIPRMQHHSVIRCAKSKIAASLHNEKNMVKLQNEAWCGDPQGFVSSDSVTPEDNSGVKPAQEHLNSEARRAHEDSRSNQVEDSEDEQLMESDVIDIAKSREDTLGESSWNQAATLGPEKNKKELEGQTQRSQEEKPPAPASQQILEAEELPHGAPASQQVLEAEELPCGARSTPDSPRKFGKENVFLLDASKEGNVGRFLNHSCRPNLLVQKVFVETHDRDFPLMAFFTSRYVKARTELTWDYGYEAGTVPDKEIVCQCGVNKCRKKII